MYVEQDFLLEEAREVQFIGSQVELVLKDKTEVFATFRNFHAFITAQPGLKLKYLMTDNGGRYVGNQFTYFCAENGIKRELTTPYNPASNSMAVKCNRKHYVKGL